MSGLELFGAGSGAAALIGVFTSCVDFFEYVQIGRNFGDDYQRCLVRLDNQAYRLSIWGEAVGLYKQDATTSSMNTQAQLAPRSEEKTKQLQKAARKTLVEIMQVLEKAREKSERFESNSGQQGLEVYDPKVDLDPIVRPLHQHLQGLTIGRRRLARLRQKEASLVQLTRWALYDKKRFEGFIVNISDLIDELVEIAPPNARKVQETLLASELSTINNRGALEALLDATDGDDELLQEVGKRELQKRTGHTFVENEVNGGGQIGDYIAGDYKGHYKLTGSYYKGNKVSGGNGLIGDCYGGPGPYGYKPARMW